MQPESSLMGLGAVGFCVGDREDLNGFCGGGPVSATETGDFGQELGGIHVKSSNMALKRE